MRLRLAVAVLAIVVALVARPAAAQGTSDLFPDPMTSADIEAVLTRLGLSGDTKVAALKAFDGYVERSLSLRKGDIDAYLASRPDPDSKPTREEIAARVDRRRAILKKFAAIESQYFDELNAAAPGHQADVERERSRAERRRNWSASNPFFGRGTRIELADLLTSSLGDETLKPETERAIVDVLKSYEDQYTSLSRKLLDLAVEEPIALMDARAASNAQPPSSDGPAADTTAWREYFKAMEAARAKAREPQANVRERIRTVQRTTAKQVTDLLPEPVASKFHQSVMERAYPMAANPRDPVPALLAAAKDLAKNGDLSADELQRITELATQHATARRQIDEQLMAALDKEPSAGMFDGFVFRIDGENPDETRDPSPSERLLTSRNDLDAATQNAINGTSPKLAEKAKTEAKPQEGQVVINGAAINIGDLGIEPGGGAVEIMVVGGSDLGGADFTGGVVSIAQNFNAIDASGAASVMTREDIDRIRDRFKLSGDQVETLALMYEDYLASWKDVEEGDLAELKSLPSEMGMPGEPGRVATQAELARRFELRRAVTERVIQLDKEFCENLAAAFSGSISRKEATRLQRARERKAYLATDSRTLGMLTARGFGESESPTIDLGEVVLAPSVTDEIRAAIEPQFDSWDAASIDAFRSRFETRFAAARVQAEFDRTMAVEAAKAGRPGEITFGTNLEENEDFRKVRDAGERAGKADETTAQLNESTIAAMADALTDADQRQTLLDAWDRKAWPSVFRDRRDVEPFITKAFGLEDLTPEARAKITTIVAEYRAEYRRISNEMIATNRKTTQKDGKPAEEIDFRALQARQDTINRLRFERNELNEKTLRRIKETLSPEQSTKVGDLPKERQEGQVIRFGGE